MIEDPSLEISLTQNHEHIGHSLLYTLLTELTAQVEISTVMPHMRIEILYSLFSQTVHKTVKRRWRDNTTGMRKEFDIKIYCTSRITDSFTDNMLVCSRCRQWYHTHMCHCHKRRYAH